MRRMQRILCALLLPVLMSTAPARALQATVIHSGIAGLWLTDVESGTSELLLNERTTGMGVFSPDGRRIAYAVGTRLYVMNNDGTQTEQLSSTCDPQMGYMYWTQEGIFWMDGYTIMRYDLGAGRQHSITRLYGEESEGFWMARDARRGLAWVTAADGDPRLTFAADYSDATISRWEHISHGMTITSDGASVVFYDYHNRSGNPGHVVHKCFVVQQFEETAIGQGLVTFANFPEFDSTTPNHHPVQSCWNDPDYLAVNTRGPSTYVVNWRTEEFVKTHRPRPDRGYYSFYPSALWMGELPSVEPTAPVIALQPNELRLNGDTTAAVVILNEGIGTLGTVTLDVYGGVHEWLSAQAQGSGNEQRIAVTATVDTLSEGSYRGSVTVSGGGATNQRTVTVYLTVGATLPAPTDLTAAVQGDTVLQVHLSWAETSATETGFTIERNNGDQWQVIGTVPANTTSFVDDSIAPGTYTYRVQALSDAGFSPYSAEHTIDVISDPVAFVLSPASGQALTGGSTFQVTWLSRGITAVQLEYSTNDGETWTLINPDKAIGEASPDWQNYPWQVPDIDAPQVLLSVHQYGEPSVGGVSAPFSIVPSSNPVQRHAGRTQHTYGIESVVQAPDGAGVLIRGALPADGAGQVEILSMQGRRLAALTVVASRECFAVKLPMTTGSVQRARGSIVVRLAAGAKRWVRVVALMPD